jgi:hypothetical protein
MGYDIVAYLDVDQALVQSVIDELQLDSKSYKNNETICDHVITKMGIDPKETLHYGIMVYIYSDDCQMHEIQILYGTNFIRDETRFKNRRFHKMLEDKVGRPFPDCLKSINWNVRTREDALEVAEELPIFFPDDQDLLHFADWLKSTAKYCSTYELSY